MITFEGIGITIHAHTDGDFDRAHAEQDLTPGQLFGLDTEGPYMNEVGVFSEDFHLRLVQVATSDVVHVFDMQDVLQRAYVREILHNVDNSFCAHTNHDTCACAVTLGEDISLRCVDTRMLATMAQPDDRDGGNDLKTLSATHLGPWLKQAQARLQGEFDRLCDEYNAGILAGIEKELSEFEGTDSARKREMTRLKKDHGFLSTTEEKDRYAWSAIDKTNEAYLIYAGLDAVACRRLVPILVELSEAPPTLLKMETWADAQAAQWKIRGYRIDREAHRALWESAEEHCEKHAKAFGEIVYEEILKAPVRNPHYVRLPISPRSGKKVARFLREHGADFAGYPLTDKGKILLENDELTYEMEISGEYASLSKKHKPLLEAMDLDEVGRLALDHLLEFKEREYTVTKMKEVQKVMDSKGYVHPTLRTIGAVTGRMSSSGPNFQNFGKTAVEMRETVIPSPGNVFVACDFDQIELRVVAALARVHSMIKVILEGGDLHSLTAMLAHCTRTIAKIVGFLIVYGGGAKALNEQTGIPLDECRKIIATYKEGVPEIVDYSEQCAQFEESIRPVSGRKIPVGKTKDGRSRSYANVNYMVQGSARELAVAAWWRYQHDPDRKGWAVMIIHDEIVVECPFEHWEEELARLERAMTMNFMHVPISAGGCVLADKEGVSRWTSVDAAEKYAKYRKERGVKVLPAV